MGRSKRTNTWLLAIAVPACLLLATGAYGSIAIPAGGSLSLASGAMDLGCTDIDIASAGILRLDSAPVSGVRNVTIQPGGMLDFGTGSITVAGSFTNNNGILLNLGPGSIILVNNPACAPNGPSISGLANSIPALGAGGLVLLGLILAASGILVTRRRTQRINERG
jgi:hypothetical protein